MTGLGMTYFWGFWHCSQWSKNLNYLQYLLLWSLYTFPNLMHVFHCYFTTPVALTLIKYICTFGKFGLVKQHNMVTVFMKLIL